MHTPASNLAELLRAIEPVLNPGVQVFVTLPAGEAPDSLQPLATFREAEGLTLIVGEQQAVDAQLPVLFRAAWITLSVHSDLAAIGLTAAVATALADADISCNVVAAAYHDHLFVPVDSAAKAIAVLRTLQQHSGPDRGTS